MRQLEPNEKLLLLLLLQLHCCTLPATTTNDLKTIKLIYRSFASKQDFLNIFVCKTIERDPKDLCRKCCWVVDIAYKWGVLYVWLPEVKSMFAQIVIDCQTQKETVSCEYCIVKENCHLRLELEGKIGIEKEQEPSGLLVPLLTMEVPVFR